MKDWGSCIDAVTQVATLNCIPIVLNNIIYALVVLAGTVCVFLIIYSGYKFVSSEGDPEKIGSARKTLFYAIGGFVFVLASFLLLSIIGNFTGVKQLIPK